MRTSGPIRLLLRGILFLPPLFLPLLLDPVLQLSGIEARHLAAYERLATQLRAGHVTRIGWDLRALKRLATPKAPPYQILVLGSSRCLPITQTWFPGKSLWNAGVDSGSLDDAAALLHTALEANQTPGTVILEVSASLGRDSLPGASRALDAPRERARARYGLSPTSPFSQPLDITLWWGDGLRRLLSTLRDLDAAPAASASTYTLNPDGTLALPDFSLPPAPMKTMADMLRRLPPEQLAARSLSLPTPGNAALFRSMLDDLKARGIRVIILTPPIHPAAWDFFRKRGGYNDTWLRAELAPRKIQLVGTFSPHESRATEADFFDAFHPHPALLRRLLTEANIVPQPQPAQAINALP